MIHLHVEVAHALVVIAQPAIALVEQILVDGAFFEDGNHMPDAFRAHVGAFDQHLDLRSPVGGETEVGIWLGGVLFRLQLDFSFQPLARPGRP